MRTDNFNKKNQKWGVPQPEKFSCKKFCHIPMATCTKPFPGWFCNRTVFIK